MSGAIGAGATCLVISGCCDPQGLSSKLCEISVVSPVRLVR